MTEAFLICDLSLSNYYLQYIRNNYGRGRTPKWGMYSPYRHKSDPNLSSGLCAALRAGLVEDNTAYVKSTRQWGNRYGERNPNNVYDDPNAPYQDEFGNWVQPEGWVEEHGIRPAQPGGGFGPDGNDLHPQEEDLLEGLPDEERERRRRQKRQHKREYGGGLEDMDREEEERMRRATNGNGANGSARGDDLIGDLPEDPDIAMYRREQQGSARNKGGRFSSFGSSRTEDSEQPTSSKWSSSGGKKSGRAKKSERYGIRADHADLSSSYGNNSSSKSSSKFNKGRTASQSDYNPRPSNDRYDIIDDEPSSGRRRGGDE